MKQLPIGTQSFEILRNNECLYVDKTEIIHRIISNGRVYFLSRPRRFGKSLLISTLEAIFKGQKALFRDLWIYDKWNWSQRYPVIKIDWTQINHSTTETMEESMTDYLKEIARDDQITLVSKSASGCFRELIKSLHNKSGDRQVVILIDEYDMPVTGHLFDPNLRAFQTAIHDFYQVMKGADKYIRFIFLTGVSKFSGLSIFSALNSPDDITLNVKYAAICGYTQEELERNFTEHIDSAAEYLNMSREKTLDNIRYWYNGYTWDGKTAIYNPFSTLKFFSDQRFAHYWFRTGTPTFLIDIIQRRNSIESVLAPIRVDESMLDGYDTDEISEVPLLFQTGYLTVRQMELTSDGCAEYTLGVPNAEVNGALLKCLLKAYGKYPDDRHVDRLRKTMQQQLIAGDESGFARSLETMVATVPYELHIAKESYYHSLMLIWMRLLGFRVHAEEHNHLGRSDAVWEQPGLTVVAEIKYSRQPETQRLTTLLDEALKQIRDRRYYNLYSGKILLLAIAFSGKETGCRMEHFTT